MTIPRFNPRPDPIPRPPSVGPVPPIAEFSFVKNGLEVQFTSLSSDPDGEIVEHRWDFGDSGALPVAQFTAQPGSGLTINFTDTSFDPGGSVVAWLWQFGDGTTSTAQHPSKTYASGGAYTVRLTATDNEGNASIPFQQIVLVGGGTGGTGIRLGAYSLWDGTTGWPTVGTTHVDCAIGSTGPSAIIDRINFCRSTGRTFFPNLAGGSETKYLTNGVFDPGKWETEFAKTDTPSIRAAIAEGVADSIIPGAILMDEPANQRWGGYFNTNGASKLDAMADFAHSIHPTLPIGPVMQPDEFPGQVFSKIDFIGCQYGDPKGDLEDYIAECLARAAASAMKIYFSINVLDGGILGRPCGSNTGGTGTFGQRCRVTAAQLESWGLELGAVTIGLLSLWRYDDAFFSKADNQAALATVAAFLATRPRGSLKRGV